MEVVVAADRNRGWAKTKWNWRIGTKEVRLPLKAFPDLERRIEETLA